jgi:hypothetical protein
MSDETETDDTISDETIEALALAPAMLHPIDGEAARQRPEVRERCPEAWRQRTVRSGILHEPLPRITDNQVRRLRAIAVAEGSVVLMSVAIARSARRRPGARARWPGACDA